MLFNNNNKISDNFVSTNYYANHLVSNETHQYYPNTQYSSNNQPVGEPKEYRVWSIINSFLAFSFGGLICFAFSTKIRKLKQQGNIHEAKLYSRRVLLLNLAYTFLSFVSLGLLVYSIYSIVKSIESLVNHIRK